MNININDLEEKISNAVESVLSELYNEHNIKTGDISPEQTFEWERLSNDFACLLTELVKQNK